jgi:DNA repair protein RecN (Recombination protein N)
MLRRLTIRDFVLVDRLELDFEPGFGVLTGETGAGKSILVDALSFALGERADAGVVRAGQARAEVSAEFDVAGLPEVLDRLRENDLDAGDGHELILRRVVESAGRSRAYLNGSPVTIQQLREITDALIDIHGQHAHQSLLKADAQRAMLDAYAQQTPVAAKVGAGWREWQAAEARYESALAGGEAIERERAALAWEVEELDRLALAPGEWDALNAEQGTLAHAAALIEGAQAALDGLGESEGACLGTLGQCAGRLESLAEFDARLGEIAALVRAAEADVGEAVSDLRRYAGKVDLDPQRLAELDRRLEAILTLARKFRIPVESIPDVLAERRQKLAALSEGTDPAALRTAADAARDAFMRDAGALSKAREKAAKDLSAKVTERMRELALGGGVFEVALVAAPEGGSFGLERVEFRVAQLAGNEARPLAKVASGGELSRISLALQVVASGTTQVPTLVFDEVDVGIGGGVAEVVGRLLKTLGATRQVLCVTHLPQVAARADWQWKVAKSRAKLGGADVFRSEVLTLDPKQRVDEIARMLGGVEITELTRKHAAEMLSGG